MDTAAATKCLPLNVSVGDGEFDELPLRVTVNAKGQARATATSRKVVRRLAASADPCIRKLVEATTFAAGDGAITVHHTLRFD